MLLFTNRPIFNRKRTFFPLLIVLQEIVFIRKQRPHSPSQPTSLSLNLRWDAVELKDKHKHKSTLGGYILHVNYCKTETKTEREKETETKRETETETETGTGTEIEIETETEIEI